MTFTELIREVWQTSKERVKHPILGAFIFSWCAINYEVLLILFSSIEPIAKIFFIDRYTTWYGSTIVPFGVALVLRVLLGYMSWLQEVALKTANTGRSQLSTEIDKLQYQRRTLKAENEYLIDRLRTGEDHVTGLKKKVESLESEKSVLNDEIDSHKKGLADIEKEGAKQAETIIELKNQNESILADYYSAMSRLSGIPVDEYTAPKVDGIYENVKYILSVTDSRTRRLLQEFKNIDEPEQPIEARLADRLLKSFPDENLIDHELSDLNQDYYLLNHTGLSLYYALRAGDFNPGFKPSLY